MIVRESKYQPDLVGRGGTIGLMQIKLATARGLGYTGDAEGLRDPDTNLTYGVKYLAGAYRAANGDHDRAIHYYCRRLLLCRQAAAAAAARGSPLRRRRRAARSRSTDAEANAAPADAKPALRKPTPASRRRTSEFAPAGKAGRRSTPAAFPARRR